MENEQNFSQNVIDWLGGRMEGTKELIPTDAIRSKEKRAKQERLWTESGN